jgi:alpha-maltose-1-phosphate synthase
MALKDLNCLERFFTSSYIVSKWLQEFLTKRGDTFWTRRFLIGLHDSDVESNWRFEFREMLFSKLYGHTEKTIRAVYDRDVNFDRYIAAKLPALRGEIFWGFQGSCFESLAAARRSSKIAVCELATAHAPAARRILGEEQQLHPEWADSIDNVSFPDDYYKRLCEEPHRADIVIGASEFTLQTLRDDNIDESKLRLLPLGFELAHIPYVEQNAPRKGPLKLLYAGRITQRKGIKYLLEAMKQFGPEEVELHIIGFIHGSGEAFRRYDNFVHHGPMQQYELFRKYQEFDAFVLPSVFEGFGLVVLEAMAAGLPVITTPNSIGPELITNDSEGYIVPIRNTEAIVRAIRQMVNNSPEQQMEMKKRARAKALQYSWNAYRTRLAGVISTFRKENMG